MTSTIHRTECIASNRIEDPNASHLVPQMGAELGPQPVDALSPLILREPRQEDAGAIWELVRTCDSLDLNSPYAYMLLCTDFAQTSLVARARRPGAEAGDEEGDLVGFVLGYRRPSAPEALFVWQIGVCPTQRGKGTGGRLLAEAFDRCRASVRSVEFLEATVTPSNRASRMLFTGFARDRSARMHESVAFWSASFPETDGKSHEDELRLRIGPVRPAAA